MNAIVANPIIRRPAASDVARLGDARRRRLPLRGLARAGRPVVVADAAARAAGPRALAVQVRVGVRRLAGPARRARGAGQRRRDRRASARASRSGSATGSASPAGGARSPTRCASSASGARCARTPTSAGSGSSATCRSTSRRAAPTTVAWPSLFRSGEVAGRAAGRVHRQGPAVGQPAVRLAGAAAPRLPLVDRAAAAHVRAVRRHADRPLPRLRRLLGGARGRAGRARRALAPRARGGRCSTPRRASSASCPSSPRTSASSPSRSTRLRRALGFPGMVVMQFGFDPDDPHGPHRLEHHEADSVVYTGTHDNDTLRGWWETLPDAVRARPRPRRSPRPASPRTSRGGRSSA